MIMTAEINIATAYIKPAPGRRVRKPDGSVLQEEGAEVERNAFWQRRLLDGDVIEAERPKGKKG